jgi:hypothetical protein
VDLLAKVVRACATIFVAGLQNLVTARIRYIVRRSARRNRSMVRPASVEARHRNIAARLGRGARCLAHRRFSPGGPSSAQWACPILTAGAPRVFRLPPGEARSRRRVVDFAPPPGALDLGQVDRAFPSALISATAGCEFR